MDRAGDPRPGSGSPLERVAERVRRFLRPPRTLRPTRAGWLFFALTFGVGFSAMNSGNNLLYMVLSLLLAFLVLSGVLSESALRGIRVRRRLPREIFAETPVPVVIEIHNAGTRVPSFALVVEDLAGPRTERATPAGRIFCLRIGPGETESRAYRLSAPRRGPLRLAGFRVSTRFPFGLFSKAMLVESPAEALVYPRVEPLPVRHEESARAQTGRASGGSRGESPEVAGLVVAQPGGLRALSARATGSAAGLGAGALLVAHRQRLDARVDEGLRG